MGDENNVQEFSLKEDNELRFEVGDKEVVLELLEGQAEIFGSELELHKRYVFPPGMRIAVFTYFTAQVELVGPTVSAYVAEQTPMIIYLNTHAGMETIRKQAEKTGKRGPRVMYVGPTDVGKSTVCRIICNYSVRMGRSPILVDLDVGQGSISVPGTIGALFLNKTADVVEGFDRSKPIVFNVGAVTPSANLVLYDSLVKELAEVVGQRCKLSPEANIGGIVISTCGWINGDGYQCLVNAAEAFEVDAVVVIDHERLYNDLQKDLPKFVKILHQPKSGGVETRSRETRMAARSSAIHKYFYGSRYTPLYPYTFQVAFTDVIIAKIGTEKLPDSCLPYGAKQVDHHTKVVSVKPSADLLHSVLAVSPCPTVSQAVVKEPVVGFVVVTELNMEEKKLTLLCPQQQLPNKCLVLTSVKFLDDQGR